MDIEGYGDVRTLEEALEYAQEGTLIKMCEGVHFSCAVIKIGGIRIEPYYKDRAVYLLGNYGPTIKIDVPMDDPNDENEATLKQVSIKRIVMAHNGEAIAKHFKELNLSIPDIHKRPNVACLKDMKLDPSMNTIILINSGSLILRNCLLTLQALAKDITRKVPCIVGLPGTHLTIVNCEFVGSKINLTAALVTVNATKVCVSMSRFTKFIGGAVYSVAEGKDLDAGVFGSEYLMQDCKFDECSLMAVYL